MRKKLKDFSLADHIRNYFKLTPFERIIPWAEKNIDFSQQISAERNKLDFDMYPYQIPILKQWQNDKKKIKTIVVMAPEQVGKTNMFIVGALYNFVYNPCQSLIVYPSDHLAIETNKTKFLPLMRHIPVLKAELERKRAYRSDCYKFSNLISYFQGAGSKIVSKSCKIVIGDEVDAWKPEGTLKPVADLKKRTRSYNSSICFLISTPSTQKGDIWLNFLQGSRGYWYLRCKNCNQLTMRSCDTNNLQFEAEYDPNTRSGVVKAETIRLICPKCKHEHTQQDKRWMNINGGFIHEVPERMQSSPSFQIGGLASQLPSMCWQKIANEQLKAGKSADLKDKIDFQNSYRGLPYIDKKIQNITEQSLRRHQWSVKEAPVRDQMQMVFMTADTQDDRSVVGVWAWSTNDNYYLLKIAEPKYLTISEQQRKRIDEYNKQVALQTGELFKPLETVEDILNAEYLVEDGVGIKPLFCLMDQRGHRMQEVQYFMKSHPNVLGWLGGKVGDENHFKESQNVERAINADAKWYQKQAIYYLHDQKKRDNQYLFFYPDIEERFIQQILACKPDPNTKWGHMPQNWTFGNRVHDYFDVTKMAFCARDYATKRLMLQRFRYCKSPRLVRWREQQLMKNQEKNQTKTKIKVKKSDNWFGEYKKNLY